MDGNENGQYGWRVGNTCGMWDMGVEWRILMGSGVTNMDAGGRHGIFF